MLGEFAKRGPFRIACGDAYTGFDDKFLNVRAALPPNLFYPLVALLLVARMWRAQPFTRRTRPVPLHYADPNKKQGRWYKAVVENYGRSRLGLFMARRLFPRVDPWLYRATGGRYPSILGGISTAPLMTTGAKSGQPREHQLTYFHDGPDPIVIASNYGGPKHPQWYYNLKAHPECELGDEKFLASEVTDPDEYARVYGLAEHVSPGWGDNRRKANSIGRRIPVFRLKPR